MYIYKAGVIGAGTMGAEIAQVITYSGLPVVLKDVSEELVQKGLARISANPGKTQTLNYFLVNNSFYLVDMPGYGYAKVSKEQRVTWSAFSGMFLQKCENLLCLLILVDATIIPQEIDIRFINWCGEQGIPITIIRTKIDKSKPSELDKLEKLFLKTLSEQWAVMRNRLYN